jgi:hypothetical protein
MVDRFRPGLATGALAGPTSTLQDGARRESPKSAKATASGTAPETARATKKTRTAATPQTA